METGNNTRCGWQHPDSEVDGSALPQAVSVVLPFRIKKILTDNGREFGLDTCADAFEMTDFILKKAVGQKDKAVEFEFYAMEDGADVVQYVKVGSPSLLIRQHRSGRTIRVRA
jgi:hypothetical protein